MSGHRWTVPPVEVGTTSEGMSVTVEAGRRYWHVAIDGVKVQGEWFQRAQAVAYATGLVAS